MPWETCSDVNKTFCPKTETIFVLEVPRDQDLDLEDRLHYWRPVTAVCPFMGFLIIQPLRKMLSIAI